MIIVSPKLYTVRIITCTNNEHEYQILLIYGRRYGTHWVQA
jgi:hypothetical protein